MSEPTPQDGRTLVMGERQLAIGFRLIGLKDVIEITRSNAQSEFQKAMAATDVSLLIASQSVRQSLTEAQRQHAESSLRPLVVFVPPPSGEYEVESIDKLAKRVLGVSLAMPSGN
ncbi:MAG: hypothetical protein L3K09_01810 [Thermoplasmata archaeon]|nr:hypothetical protein [Thermoplasmata archaeon]